MGGFHFVGVDHQHRLGIDLGVGRQQQVLVRQAGIGAVGAGLDGDTAVEHNPAAAGADPAPEQAAGRVAGNVLDAQTGIQVAAAGGQQHAVGVQAGLVAGQAHVELVARQRAAQLHVDPAIVGGFGQLGFGAQEGGGAVCAGLDAGMLQLGVRAHGDFHQRVVQMAMLTGDQMVLGNGQAGFGAQFNPVAQVPGQLGAILRRTHEHQLQRALHAGAGRHGHTHALAGQVCGQAGEDGVGTRIARVIAGNGFGGDLDRAIQTFAVRQRFGVAAVDEHEARGRDAFQQGRIDFNRGAGRGELAALERAQRGVLPGLAARARQTVAQGRVQRGAVGGVALETGGQRLQQGTHATSGAMRSLTQE